MRKQDERGKTELVVKRAIKTAREEREIEMAKEMIIDNEPIDKIIRYTKLDIDFINKLVNEMKNSH